MKSELVLTLLMSSGMAQVVTPVDICDLFANPIRWSGQMIQVRALVDPGFDEGGPWLSGEHCSTSIEVKGIRFPNLVFIDDPEERLDQRLSRSGFEWPATDRSRFFDVLRNSKRACEAARATIVGRFETRTPLDGLVLARRASRYNGFGEGLIAPARILVRSVVDVVSEKRAQSWPPRLPERVRQQRELWLSVRNALVAADGPVYFETRLKGARVPGGASGLNTLRGTVVAHARSTSPDQSFLLLALADNTTVDATLRLPASAGQLYETGSTVEFSGVAAEFRRDPFMLVFDANKVFVLPEPSCPASIH